MLGRWALIACDWKSCLTWLTCLPSTRCAGTFLHAPTPAGPSLPPRERRGNCKQVSRAGPLHSISQLSLEASPAGHPWAGTRTRGPAPMPLLPCGVHRAPLKLALGPGQERLCVSIWWTWVGSGLRPLPWLLGPGHLRGGASFPSGLWGSHPERPPLT